MKSLAGKVCIVTGATRGIGRGIALQLGEAGATVYITGRTMTAPKGAEVKGSLKDTAEEVVRRGGQCIPVLCDHSKDEDIEKLFKRVENEQGGQLDLLVNNVFAAVHHLQGNVGVPFWEQDLKTWDIMNNVGLRNHYICSVMAARLMTPRQTGLIINVSSIAGLLYIGNAADGAGKQASDRMARDCSIELKKHNIAFVSYWPGTVRTERNAKFMSEAAKDSDQYNQFREMFDNAETVEYSGKCVVSLASDPNIMDKTGRILLSADIGQEYGFVDIDGRSPPNRRQLKGLLSVLGHSWLGACIPGFVNIPKWTFALFGNKF